MAERSFLSILGRAIQSTETSLSEEFSLRIFTNWETMYSTTHYTIYWDLFKINLEHQTSKGSDPFFTPAPSTVLVVLMQNTVRNLWSMGNSSAGRHSKHQQSRELLKSNSRTDNESLLTWAVVSALHIEQMASASSSVFFFTCNNCAAWMRGSSVSLAPLFIKFLSRSHSSSWLTLYLYKEVKVSRH